jgi:hypothetical protein
MLLFFCMCIDINIIQVFYVLQIIGIIQIRMNQILV